MPANIKPFVDDASLLTPVAEEALGNTATPEAAVEAHAPGSAADPEHHADEQPAQSTAPDNSSTGEHHHEHHATLHEELVQHCEHSHASGLNSKRSSVADGGELRSTTSGQLRAATEHSIMSIASGEPPHAMLNGYFTVSRRLVGQRAVDLRQ
jgi:hypothetical protein